MFLPKSEIRFCFQDHFTKRKINDENTGNESTINHICPLAGALF